MDQRNEFAGTRADLMTCIQALLALDCYSVLSARDLGRSALSLLTAAEKELARAHSRIAELEAENAGLSLDKLTAPAAQDGLRIVRGGMTSDQCWQDYHVHPVNGAESHYCMVRVVRRMRGNKNDEPAFALIERRLLAGNPVEV